jgi:hypothetical protein
MGVRWYYRPSWRPVAEDPAIEFTEHVRLYTLDVTENAEEGSVATSNIMVEDPDGTFDFPPLTRIWGVEAEVAQSSNTYVYHGYIASRRIHRGDSTLTSSARVWDIEVVDENSILTRRVLSSPNANRPAETDVQRVTWLANEADGQLLIDSTEWLFEASPVAMDAVDYRGQTAQEVLNDCAQASGKNYYAYFKEGTGTGLWYGSPDHTGRVSMVRLTNVLGEVNHDQNIYEISRDTVLERDPSRLLSGLYGQYAEQAVYVRNDAMFRYIGLRDLPFSWANVKTQAKAIARANRSLADLDSEEDRITTTVIVPAARVNWIKAGYRVRFRAVHLPGYEDFVWLRVLHRSVVQTSEQLDNGSYTLTLELGTGSIPESPTVAPAEPPGETILSANLLIGSATFLGLGADRENHWATNVGGSPVALTAGRAYRLKMTITDNLNPPTYGSDHLATLGARLNIAAGSTTIAGSSYGWHPPVVPTALLEYPDGGPSWTVRDPVRDGGTAPNNSYAVGSVITGDWQTYEGDIALPAADFSLNGSPLSGFFGFRLGALVELQERAG